MNDYYCLHIASVPATEEIYDLMSSFLADIGFESFVTEGDKLLAYVPAPAYDRAAAKDVVDNFPIPARISLEEEFIPGKDWNEEWEKNYFQPIVIGDRCVIHSTFHRDYPACEYEIVIDPRMAFGTGHHATTSMMVSYLLETDLRGKTVTDMGTGTGILAILARKRGAGEVTGIEIDGVAYENAVENSALNNTQVNFLHGDASLLRDAAKADIFLANINRNVILADLEAYISNLKPGGLIFLSGFLIEDIPLIEAAADESGMQIASIKRDNEWVAVALQAKK